ncbi:hypothetical protein M6D81_13575 [Paenibacillus sp. J5C_2022]|uniref:tetratricopeptide repeat protein n=1 Tax=Paenibacillus sp. J5C2022 TaxID=2977129 RepID=UPI0021CF1BA1|nr:hypothetical protein [Paenibacillus sp. J5C2022]MCU6709727.1 hypothetical protein [Paenibacillus sp. J5C2022]
MDYYSRLKSGGSNLAGGIAYQDMVGLLYLFIHIKISEFKEITFESHDDFTMIMSDHEVYVQVKNTQLGISQIREILESKSFNTKSKSVKHVVIASKYDGKAKSLLEDFKRMKNACETLRSEEDIINVRNEFNQLLHKNGLNPDIFHETVFEEFPSAQISEVVKFHMYDWSSKQNLAVEIDDWFDKLISYLSLDLRVHRGSLKKKEIEELAIKYPKREVSNHIAPKSIMHYDHSKNSILLALTKDIAENKHFAEKLTFIKLYTEMDRWDEAQQKAEELINYGDTFKYYYLWFLYQSGKYNRLMDQCNQFNKQELCPYYSNYYKGLVFLERFDYSKAIDCLQKALLNDNTFDVNLRLAQLYNLSQNKIESLKYYRLCLSKQPLNAELLVEISPLLLNHEAITFLDKALEINPEIHQAYFEKGKILRYYGMNKDANEYFQKYLSLRDILNKESDEVLKEISLCLLSLGDEKAYIYMNDWLINLLYNKSKNKKVNDEIIVIMDNSWLNTQLIVCKKSGEDYIVSTPISEYILTKREESFIGIGCMSDSFLRMSANLFRKNNVGIPNDYEYIPAIVKAYRSKNEFNKVIKSMRLDHSANLNKDYLTNTVNGSGQWHFKEYISEYDSTSVLIDELQNAMHVQIEVGNFRITGWFNKGGENYFMFNSKVENSSANDEAVLILECEESKEIIHIKFNVGVIKIVKSANFPRKYVRDVVLPV